jgi:hypothetical protein
MNRTKLALPLLLLLAACGGNVVVDGLSGTSATGAGGFATTGGGGAPGTSVGAGTVFSTTGVGGSQGTSTVTATATTSVGAGGSTTTGCAGGSFFLNPGNAAISLSSSCSSQSPQLPVPYGWEFNGGASGNPGTLNIEGCETSAPNSLGIVISAPGAFAPGTYMISGVEILGGTSPGTLTGTLTVITFGPVDGTISGYFEIGQGQNMLEGKFDICRAPDIDAP